MPITPAEKTICKHCSTGEVEDELHFIMKCPKHDIARKKFMEFISKKVKHFSKMPLEMKFEWIFSQEDDEIGRAHV